MGTEAEKRLTLFMFADTHGQHRNIVLTGKADVVVFAGDACNNGNMDELTDFLKWFSELPVKYKLFVPGNHDLIFELNPGEARKLIPENVVFVEEGVVTLDGIRFCVLPARPYLHSKPAELPDNIDVLVTHGAPKGILDENGKGCPLLREVLTELNPEVHIFGHFHESAGRGSEMNSHTTFINSSVFFRVKEITARDIIY
jgi:Icc-related predicted phosphoesterase